MMIAKENAYNFAKAKLPKAKTKENSKENNT